MEQYRWQLGIMTVNLAQSPSRTANGCLKDKTR